MGVYLLLASNYDPQETLSGAEILRLCSRVSVSFVCFRVFCLVWLASLLPRALVPTDTLTASPELSRTAQLSEFTPECPNLDRHSDFSPSWPGDESSPVCTWPENTQAMGKSLVNWETSMTPGSKGCSKSKSHLSLSRSASITSSCPQPPSWLACFPSNEDIFWA